MAPFGPSFPRWYNACTRCDYHAGNPDHSTKNCTALKHKVQDLINLGKLKFEESNELVGIEDLFGAKTETTRQEEKTPKEIGSRKATIRRDEVSISKVRRGEAEGSSTIERSKERSCELNQEEENKTLHRMVRELKQMLKEQKNILAPLERRKIGRARV